jgi:hypothetical protein
VLHEPPSITEGAGNAGCPLHPQPRVRCDRSTRAYSPQVHRSLPAFPAQWFTAYSVLSPVTGLSCHRRRRETPADLAPASGCQDHTSLPSADSIARQARCRVHRIPFRVVDVAQRPSVGQDGPSRSSDLPDGESEIFFCEALDRALKSVDGLICPSGKSPAPCGAINTSVGANAIFDPR